MNPDQLPPQHPFGYLATKYWWVTLPVFAIAMKRHLERRKKGNATAFDVFNDLGVLSFPITGVVALYEFGQTKQKLDQIIATQNAQQTQL